MTPPVPHRSAAAVALVAAATNVSTPSNAPTLARTGTVGESGRGCAGVEHDDASVRRADGIPVHPGAAEGEPTDGTDGIGERVADRNRLTGVRPR